MTASSTPISQCAPSADEISTAEIDASCRLPMFVLLGGAAFWLAVSSVFGLIASIKFHSPQFLADCAWLTYGRVYPAWSNLLVFGFCIPAGLAVGLWLLARLGKAKLAAPLAVAAGGKLWNFGVLVGLLGILAGGSTGFEWFEMPRYAAVILLLAFLLIAVCGFVTFNVRRDRENLYPSQWFVLASLFWFPWIYSTAILLLDFFPVRGIAQSAVAWWFSGNLFVVWLSLAGLGPLLYFLPKLSGRPLHSYYLGLFAFWTLVLFGTWVGIPSSAPLPAWMPALSSGAAMLVVVPALAIAACVLGTLRGVRVDCRGGSFCFAKLGSWLLVLSLLAVAASGVPQVSRVIDLTWFGTAQQCLTLYGFFAMTMFAAAYYILPRVTGLEFPFPRLQRAHFWCAFIGIVLVFLPLAAGGVMQGLKYLNPDIAFMDAMKSALMPFRLSTMGELLIALGNLLFLANVFGLITRHFRAVCVSAYRESTVRYESLEVKA